MTKFFRSCPTCQRSIDYKSIQSLNTAISRNALCKSCASSGSKNPRFGKFGADNPFYGKTHSEETKQKLSNLNQGKKLSEEHKKIFVQSGCRIHGNIHDFWIEKYGLEEADIRLKVLKEKHSRNNSGSGNPMYGKPSPQGSGNGWSGWYKDWFFRSLHELHFVLTLEEKNSTWKSAETKKFQVQYVDVIGKQRNYFPDFFVDGTRVVECKPKKLWTAPNIQAKSIAAIEHFEKLGYSFELVDPGPLESNRFKQLWESNEINLTKKYEEKAILFFKQINDK